MKIRKLATLEASKKAFFNEQGHKPKEPQLGRHGSAPPSPLNTPKKPKGPEELGSQKTLEAQAQEEYPKGKIAAGARKCAFLQNLTGTIVH